MALFTRPARPSFGPLPPSATAAAAALHDSAFAQGWSELDFERLLAASSTVSDAALDGRTRAPIGFILSRMAADEAEVLTIVVAPAWRGRGIGRALLDRHVAQLATLRVTALFLEVQADNAPARALYARSGFAEVGQRRGYYAAAPGTAKADALVLRRTIG